jgi:DNA-binding response OmpR family regulator
MSPSTSSQGTILIIEDDVFLSELMAKKLEDTGFEVVKAIDGKEGLEKVVTVKPSLILLDLILPGIDGFEVLKKIKDDPKSSDIPVIVLSNLGQREDIERGFDLGAQDYLVKAQFTPDEIIDRVRKPLKESHA